ncbi:hypothetical protein HU200_044126 [Digitaria exilis]|uniref:Uncharacterized protein n=1 Tax=Digitaria exilis TaxID=1010633 RepID=A0A835EFP9_9POAL|nr:hypothetical protein HU200_044126 [Digitaria exilis]
MDEGGVGAGDVGDARNGENDVPIDGHGIGGRKQSPSQSRINQPIEHILPSQHNGRARDDEGGGAGEVDEAGEGEAEVHRLIDCLLRRTPITVPFPTLSDELIDAIHDTPEARERSRELHASAAEFMKKDKRDEVENILEQYRAYGFAVQEVEGTYNGPLIAVAMQRKYAETPPTRGRRGFAVVLFVYERSSCSKARATTRHVLQKPLRGDGGCGDPLHAQERLLCRTHRRRTNPVQEQKSNIENIKSSIKNIKSNPCRGPLSSSPPGGGSLRPPSPPAAASSSRPLSWSSEQLTTWIGRGLTTIDITFSGSSTTPPSQFEVEQRCQEGVASSSTQRREFMRGQDGESEEGETRFFSFSLALSLPPPLLSQHRRQRLPLSSHRGEQASVRQRFPLSSHRGSVRQRLPLSSRRGSVPQRLPLSSRRRSVRQRLPLSSRRGSMRQRLPLSLPAAASRLPCASPPPSSPSPAGARRPLLAGSLPVPLSGRREQASARRQALFKVIWSSIWTFWSSISSSWRLI